MFPDVYKKFYGFLVLSLVLGMGGLTLFTPAEGVTGMVAYELNPAMNWPIFFIGVAVGACFLGGAYYVLHHERKRI